MPRFVGSEARTKRTPLLLGVLLVVFLLGMGLRLYDLDAISLWGDELYTATRAHLGLVSMIETLGAKGDNPPLSFVIVRSCVNLLGDSDFAYRLSSALLGSLSVLLTYKLGEILWTRQVGLLGSFLLAVNAYHIRFSQLARHYAITVFLVLLSLILLLKALETGRKRFWIGFALTATLGVYNHYFALLALASQTIYGSFVIATTWATERKPSKPAKGPPTSAQLANPGRQTLAFAFSLCLAALLFLPWLPSMLDHILGPHIEWTGFDGGDVLRIQQWLRFIDWWHFRYTGLLNPLALLLYGLFVLGLVHSKRSHALLIGLWVGVPLIFALTARTNSSAGPAYSLFVVPVYLLTVGRGSVAAASVLERPLRRAMHNPELLCLVTTLLIGLAFSALSIAPLRVYDLGRPQEDWRSAAQYLADNVRPGDLILADGVRYTVGRDSARVVMALSHYLPIYGITDTPVLTVGRGLAKDLTAVGQGQGRVWASVWYSATGSSWEGKQSDALVDFAGVLLVRPSEPSGDRLQDATSTLEVLLDVMPTEEGRFDVHLALADIYLTTWRPQHARSQLEHAAAVQPARARSSKSLRKAVLQLERVSSTTQDIRHALWANVGHVVTLVGYDINTSAMAPDYSVELTLWWGSIGDMGNDYTGFVHVVDNQGRIVVQQDRLLQQGTRPTSSWPTGILVKQKYHLQLGPDTAPGDYVINVGLYYWETGERLAVWDENGDRLPDDAIVLETIGEGQ